MRQGLPSCFLAENLQRKEHEKFSPTEVLKLTPMGVSSDDERKRSCSNLRPIQSQSIHTSAVGSTIYDRAPNPWS